MNKRKHKITCMPDPLSVSEKIGTILMAFALLGMLLCVIVLAKNYGLAVKNGNLLETKTEVHPNNIAGAVGGLVTIITR